MTVAELAERLDRRVPTRVLDVRSAAEFAEGHIPGAFHIEWTEVGRRAAELPGGPDAEVVVYCGHGPRAWMAARALRRQGYRDVRLLRGHWAAWRHAGGRIETG